MPISGARWNLVTNIYVRTPDEVAGGGVGRPLTRSSAPEERGTATPPIPLRPILTSGDQTMTTTNELAAQVQARAAQHGDRDIRAAAYLACHSILLAKSPRSSTVAAGLIGPGWPPI